MSKKISMCFWCGKDHKGRPPKSCKDNSVLMSACCKKVATFKVMRVLEVYGVDGLRTLGIELGLYRFVK